MRTVRKPRTASGIVSAGSGLAVVAALAISLGTVGPADAALVQYVWAPGPGSGGTGFMVLDLGSGTDGANFSVMQSSLLDFGFTFGNGSTVALADLNAISVSTGRWTAAGGYLTTTAQLSDTVVPRYTFQFVPYSLASPNLNGSTAVALDSNPILQNFGVWRLDAAPVSAVPLPAAAWMLGAGLLGLHAFRRRRGDSR